MLDAQGTAATPLVQVSNLKMYFPIYTGLLRRHSGDVKAVDDVSFTIRAGESLWAGDTIAAGEAYGVYAGLDVPLPDWPHSAQVSAREHPARLLSGCWAGGPGSAP